MLLSTKNGLLAFPLPSFSYLCRVFHLFLFALFIYSPLLTLLLTPPLPTCCCCCCSRSSSAYKVGLVSTQLHSLCFLFLLDFLLLLICYLQHYIHHRTQYTDWIIKLNPGSRQVGTYKTTTIFTSNLLRALYSRQ